MLLLLYESNALHKHNIVENGIININSVNT